MGISWVSWYPTEASSIVQNFKCSLVLRKYTCLPEHQQLLRLEFHNLFQNDKNIRQGIYMRVFRYHRRDGVLVENVPASIEKQMVNDIRRTFSFLSNEITQYKNKKKP